MRYLEMLFVVLLYSAGVFTGQMLTAKNPTPRGTITCFSDGTVDMRNMDISGPGFDKLPRMEVLSRLYRVLCTERAI